MAASQRLGVLASLVVLLFGSALGRNLCYKGSNLYQFQAVDCDEENPGNGGGAWYCSTMEVCENEINSKRDCAVIKSCATEAQCTDNTNVPYDNAVIKGAGVAGTDLYGGMTVKLSCCLSNEEADDDIIPLDYAGICNSASGLFGSRSSVAVSAIAAALLSIGAYFVTVVV